MPFESGRFAFVACRAAFKNFSEPVRALEEIHRVLKPGGRGWIGDLRRDASLESVNQEAARIHEAGIRAACRADAVWLGRDRRKRNGDGYLAEEVMARRSSSRRTICGRARTRMSGVRFRQRITPAASTRNSAGRAISRPSWPAPGCSTP